MKEVNKDNTDFDTWCGHVNAYASNKGLYDGNIVETTGAADWKPLYDQGLSVEDAVLKDGNYGDDEIAEIKAR